MTKNEAILVSAYTGFLLTKDFSDVHKFCEDLLGRELFTHEFRSDGVFSEIQEKARPLIVTMIEGESQNEECQS